MSRFYFLLFLIFISAAAFCQDTEAILYFNDSTSIDGYATIKWDKSPFTSAANDKILFRISKDDKPDEWDSSQVYRVELHGYAYEKAFEFVSYTFNRKTYYYLLELVTEGEVNMYVKYTTVYDNLPAGFGGGGNTVREEKTYYVKRKSEKGPTVFGGSKKKIAEYFDNCTGIVNKLATNEFNIGTLQDIVEYYNDLCVGSDGYDDN